MSQIYNVPYASMVFSPDQAVDFLKVFGPAVHSSGLPLSTFCCDGSKWSVSTSFTQAIDGRSSSSFVRRHLHFT